MYKHIADFNSRLSTQSRGEQMYNNHITVQVWKIIHESRKMSEKMQTLIKEYYHNGDLGQRQQHFLKEAREQYEQIMCFYEGNSNIVNFWCNQILIRWSLWCNRFQIYQPLNVWNSVVELMKIPFLKDCLKQVHFHAFAFHIIISHHLLIHAFNFFNISHKTCNHESRVTYFALVLHPFQG